MMRDNTLLAGKNMDGQTMTDNTADLIFRSHFYAFLFIHVIYKYESHSGQISEYL